MKIGNNSTTTTIIRNSRIGTSHMIDACDGYEPLYMAWCNEIDAALDGTGFWHEPTTSEVCGPVDAELDDEEFEAIMDAAYDRACRKINEEE